MEQSFIENQSLKKYNTFGLEVNAKSFIVISSLQDAVTFFKKNELEQQPFTILGGGSNILFSENVYQGLIIKNEIPGIHVVKENEHYCWVKAGGGVIWDDLVQSCIKANFGGIENLSLIPGTVGAAPIQNIGAYGVELKDCFEALEAVHVYTGEKRYFRGEECEFGYRNSIFKNSLRDQYFITSVVLRLSKVPELQTSYGTIQDELQKLGKTDFSIKDVSDAVIKIRQSKLPDPNEFGNGGSFFKNPIVRQSKAEDLKRDYKEMPSFPMDNDSVKIPAAWLIEKCGLKGAAHGGAAVHTKQPLVLINKNNATGRDITELAQKVQKSVKSKFDIDLEPEVKIL